MKTTISAVQGVRPSGFPQYVGSPGPVRAM
ncbi:hypothetical protein SAMN04489806_0352 [Paramicrobacterium humi]|uniref:Uncharacterized protein n=1 Tax=Paramicrobacterium humi TaxID=640635 RepID=A0A1H4IX74_9MICO|nr:hypothetical protein SAMN04489806_0352 [Microbacterium humi]